MLSCPMNITVPNDPDQAGATLNYPATTYSGNCGTVSSSHASGSFFALGSSPVTTTARRLDSSFDSCIFNITVNDTQFPTVSTPTVERLRRQFVAETSIDARLNSKSQSPIVIQRNHVVSASFARDHGCAIDPSVIDDQHLNSIDPLKLARNLIDDRGNRRFFVVGRNLNDEFHRLADAFNWIVVNRNGFFVESTCNFRALEFMAQLARYDLLNCPVADA